MSNEIKLTIELAEQELERFAESMDLDFDTSHMNDEEHEAFDRMKKTCINAMLKGKLVINDDGLPVVTTSNKEFVFKEPTGRTLLAMDKAKEGQDVHKNYHMIGAMVGESDKLIAALRLQDLKVVQAVAMLFLGSQ